MRKKLVARFSFQAFSIKMAISLPQWRSQRFFEEGGGRGEGVSKQSKSDKNLQTKPTLNAVKNLLFEFKTLSLI